MTASLAFAGAGVAVLLLAPAQQRLLRSRGLVAPNYRGEEIACPTGGLMVLVAALGWWMVRPSLLPAGLLLFAGLGFLDDVRGSGERRGLLGHVRALGERRVTTGLIKAVGGLLVAGAAAALVGGGPARVVLATLVMALSANAINLIDLRPGRALKGFILAGVPLAGFGDGALWPVLGAGLGLLPSDLGARGMMGDTGANALGFALGLALARAGSVPVLAVVLAGLVLLHVYAERASISRFVDAHPLLARFDRWGRG